jgi:hypothetical protein
VRQAWQSSGAALWTFDQRFERIPPLLSEFDVRFIS